SPPDRSEPSPSALFAGALSPGGAPQAADRTWPVHGRCGRDSAPCRSAELNPGHVTRCYLPVFEAARRPPSCRGIPSPLVPLCHLAAQALPGLREHVAEDPDDLVELGRARDERRRDLHDGIAAARGIP